MAPPIITADWPPPGKVHAPARYRFGAGVFDGRRFCVDCCGVLSHPKIVPFGLAVNPWIVRGVVRVEHVPGDARAVAERPGAEEVHHPEVRVEAVLDGLAVLLHSLALGAGRGQTRGELGERLLDGPVGHAPLLPHNGTLKGERRSPLGQMRSDSASGPPG